MWLQSLLLLYIVVHMDGWTDADSAVLLADERRPNRRTKERRWRLNCGQQRQLRSITIRVGHVERRGKQSTHSRNCAMKRKPTSELLVAPLSKNIGNNSIYKPILSNWHGLCWDSSADDEEVFAVIEWSTFDVNVYLCYLVGICCCLKLLLFLEC